MQDIHTLIEQLGESGHDIWLSQPASDDAIAALEQALGYKLPNDVKAFLAECGALGVNDSFLSGILDNHALSTEAGGMLADTALLRREFRHLEPYYIVVQKHEDGAFCLDFSDRSLHRTPVVNVEYRTTRKVASSFSEFLEDYFFAAWL